MDAVDTFFPDPKRDVDKPFLMGVESVMSITGKGTVATGRIERGMAKSGETVEIVGIKDKPLKATIAGIEMFHKTLDEGQCGDQPGTQRSHVPLLDLFFPENGVELGHATGLFSRKNKKKAQFLSSWNLCVLGDYFSGNLRTHLTCPFTYFTAAVTEEGICTLIEHGTAKEV
ncbi:unnamed protein product [Effrenium voratum]|nr:unnamed protein product [Effrenium voratum]